MNDLRPSRHSPRRRVTTLLLVCGLLVAACGTRVTDDEIIAAAGGQATDSSNDFAAGTPTGDTGVDDTTGTVPDTVPGSDGATTDTGTSSDGGAAPVTGGGDDGGGEAAAPTDGGGAAPSPAAAEAGCSSQGAPVTIGQVVSASGLIGQNVGKAVPTLNVWAQYMNENFGGLACHPIRFISKDDGSDPGRSSSAVADLKQQGAAALLGNFVPLSISGFRSGVNSAKLPVVGGDLFAEDWWQDPLFYPVGTSLEANSFGTMNGLAQRGLKKVAVIFCIEAAACPPFKDAIVNNAAKAGVEIVYTAAVSITAPDYTSQCQNAKNAGADQITMILDGSAVNRIARSCAALNYNVPFGVASLGATFAKDDPNIRKITATIASAAAPWFEAQTPGQKEFQDAMKRYAPSVELDPTTVLAWADGMMLRAAMDKLGAEARDNPLTPALIEKGLAMVQNETLGGLVAPNSFSAVGQPNPKNMCYFPATFVAEGRWTAPLGAKTQCL